MKKKKSEAIKELANHFQEVSEDKSFGIDWWEIVAEIAIEKLEDIGMSPPMNEEKSFQLGKDGQMIYEWREWEEENDN